MATDVDAAAQVALVKISTAARDVSYEAIKELVEAVVKSEKYRFHLPVLIMYLRNHTKSLAPGCGAGEKLTPVKLLSALYEHDHSIVQALLKELVMYGSWKSLSDLLTFTDQLNSNEADDHDPLSEHRFSALHRAVHRMYADQLLKDKQSLDKMVEDSASTSRPLVSNASKFSPHEGRSQTLKRHADRIAELVFSDYSPKDGVDKKHALRRLFRKLRSKLNSANNHIAEIFLSTKRAGNLETYMICAGAYTKMHKALLNLNKRGKERFDDDGRRALRAKIIKSIGTNPASIPAPSDLGQLAEKLMELGREGASADEGERALLRGMYRNAVTEMKGGVEEAVSEARALAGLLDLGEEDKARLMAGIVAAPIAVAMDCSLSQKHTHPTSCLLAMLLADCADPSFGADDGAGEAAGVAGTAGARSRVVLFAESARVVDVPPPTDAAEERLAGLVAACRVRGHAGDGEEMEVDGGTAGQGGFAAALEALDAMTGCDGLVCSDFRDAEGWAEAVRGWRAAGGGAGRTLSCWRMVRTKAGRRRARRPAWDDKNPRVDVVFCLDTTGSMGHCLEQCKRTVAEVLQSLKDRAGIPVSCAFVSYKDFGDRCRLESSEWVNTTDSEGMGRLRAFIGTLESSGWGGDRPEDVAGGLEEAGRLFAMRAQPSLRMCMLIADAPCHGIEGTGDKHAVEDGVCQLQRVRRVVREVFVDGGAELLFCNAGGGHGTEMMVKEFDAMLAEAGTYVDDFRLDHAAGDAFRDKILGELESCVAACVAPPTEDLGLDLFAGTDFSVPRAVACARLRSRLRDLGAGLATMKDAGGEAAVAPADEGGPMALGDVGGGVDKEGAGGAPADAAVTAAGTAAAAGTRKGPAAAEVSALASLEAKLAAEEYDAVRHAVAAVRQGLFAGFAWSKPLAAKALEALARAGATEAGVRAAGYPEAVVEQLREFLVEGLGKVQAGGGGAAAKVAMAAAGRGGRGRGRGRGRGAR